MARTRDRVIALIITALFFCFSFGLSFMVIWQIIQDKKEAKQVDDKTSSSQDVSAVAGQETKVTDKTPTNGQGAKLEGTKLADFTPTSNISSLTKTDLQPGSGDEVKPGDTVSVDYTGAVAATGVIFQSSLDTGQPVSFPLGNVIKGWQDGIPGMKVGGKRRLLIPAAQAYGANPPQGSNIPANADLVFDVTLHKIGQ